MQSAAHAARLLAAHTQHIHTDTWKKCHAALAGAAGAGMSCRNTMQSTARDTSAGACIHCAHPEHDEPEQSEGAQRCVQREDLRELGARAAGAQNYHATCRQARSEQGRAHREQDRASALRQAATQQHGSMCCCHRVGGRVAAVTSECQLASCRHRYRHVSASVAQGSAHATTPAHSAF